MTREEEFIEALKETFTKEVNATLFPATIKEVQETTCSIVPVGGEEDFILEDVSLSATEKNDLGLVLIPKPQSPCLVGIIGDDLNNLVLIKVDEVDKIKVTINSSTLEITKDGFVFNNGSHGGIVISEGVANEINAIKDDLNELKQVFSSSWTPTPQDGGAALKLASASWSAMQLPTLNKVDLENDKITHG